MVKFSEVEKLPENLGNLIANERDYSVYLDDNATQRRIYYDQKNDNKPYAIAEFRFEEKKVLIKYLSEEKRFFSESGNSFFHIGWEKILSREQRMILHASCVETANGGILFSGPSGVGKSTQADLWCRYENARLINGDRVILRENESEWLAYGSPYAGSSKCFVNDKCSVKAIVILKQSTECSIRRLKGMEVFRRIYEGLTINSWDKEFVGQAVDMTTKLIVEIPVYELECVPDQSAIEIIKKELRW